MNRRVVYDFTKSLSDLIFNLTDFYIWRESRLYNLNLVLKLLCLRIMLLLFVKYLVLISVEMILKRIKGVLSGLIHHTLPVIPILWSDNSMLMRVLLRLEITHYCQSSIKWSVVMMGATVSSGIQTLVILQPSLIIGSLSTVHICLIKNISIDMSTTYVLRKILESWNLRSWGLST